MPDPKRPNHHLRPEPRISDFNRPVVEEFRANGGRVGGMFEGGDLLLLTTTGANSGAEHVTPLGYVRGDDRLLVVGSAGGSPQHPDWYHNLVAHPLVIVEVGAETYEAVAVPADGAERDRLFAMIVRVAPGYADYQSQVQRTLPVVALERSASTGGPYAGTTVANKLTEIHTWLRNQLAHVGTEADAWFAAQAATGRNGDPPPLGVNLQIRQHCLAFCQSLDFHHTGEDAMMLPDLAAQFPHLRDTIERLQAEHRTVGRIRGELEGLLTDIATTDRRAFRTELARMSSELKAHLDYEEAMLLPVLATIPLPGPPPSSRDAALREPGYA